MVAQYTQLKPMKAIPITKVLFVVHFFPFELYPLLSYQGSRPKVYNDHISFW